MDGASNGDARAAVCQWFVENLDTIKESMVPKSFPRQLKNISFYQPLVIGSLVVSSLALVYVISVAVLTIHFKKTKPMVRSSTMLDVLVETNHFQLLFSRNMCSLNS